MSDDAQKVTEALRCRVAFRLAGTLDDCHVSWPAPGLVEQLTTAVFAALDLPARDARVRAEALREAGDDVQAFEAVGPAARYPTVPTPSREARVSDDRVAAEHEGVGWMSDPLVIVCGNTCGHSHESPNGPTGCCAKHGPYMYYCRECRHPEAGGPDE